jgi:hypothetical protein
VHVNARHTITQYFYRLRYIACFLCYFFILQVYVCMQMAIWSQSYWFRLSDQYMVPEYWFRLSDQLIMIISSRVSLVQLVRFLVVKLIHSNLNTKFDMSVVFTVNYSFSRRQRFHRQRDTFGDRLRESQNQIGLVF